MNTEENRLMTVPEAAKVLGVGRTKVWELVWRGKIASVKFDRNVRISPRAIEQFIREHERPR